VSVLGAGIDLVAMWLDGEKKVFNVESRDGIEQTQTTMTGKPAITHDPLVVLVSSRFLFFYLCRLAFVASAQERT